MLQIRCSQVFYFIERHRRKNQITVVQNFLGLAPSPIKVSVKSEQKFSPPSFDNTDDPVFWSAERLAREQERARRILATKFVDPEFKPTTPTNSETMSYWSMGDYTGISNIFLKYCYTPIASMAWGSLVTPTEVPPVCEDSNPSSSTLSIVTFPTVFHAWFSDVYHYRKEVTYVLSLIVAAVIVVLGLLHMFIDYILERQSIRASVRKLQSFSLDANTKRVVETFSDGSTFTHPQAFSPGNPFNVRERAFLENPGVRLESAPKDSQVLIYHFDRKIGGGVRIGDGIATAQHVIDGIHPSEIFVGNMVDTKVYPISVFSKSLGNISAFIYQQKASKVSPEFAVIYPSKNLFALLGVKSAKYAHCKSNHQVNMTVKRGAELWFSQCVVSKPNNPLAVGLPLQMLHTMSTEPGDSGTPIYDNDGRLIGLHLGYNLTVLQNYFFPIYFLRDKHTESEPMNGDAYPEDEFSPEELDRMKEQRQDRYEQSDRILSLTEAFHTHQRDTRHDASALSRPKSQRKKTPSGSNFINFQEREKIQFEVDKFGRRVLTQRAGYALWADGDDLDRMTDEDFESWKREFFPETKPPQLTRQVSAPDLPISHSSPPAPTPKSALKRQVSFSPSVSSPDSRNSTETVSLPSSGFGEISPSGIPMPVRTVDQVMPSLNGSADSIVPSSTPTPQKESSVQETSSQDTSSATKSRTRNRKKSAQKKATSTEPSVQSAPPAASKVSLNQEQLQMVKSCLSLLSKLDLDTSC